MLKYKTNCAVCNAIKDRRGLKDRIYASAYFKEDADESLPDIAKSYPGVFSAVSLYNHVKKHQPRIGPKKPAIAKKVEDAAYQRYNDRVNTAIEKSRHSFEDAEIQSAPEETWDAILALGLDKLRKGELHLTINHVLKAAKDKADFESHKKDRQVAIMKTMYGFMSGEKTETDDTLIIEEKDGEQLVADLVAGSIDQGENGSSSVHNEAPWHAFAQGADTLFERDSTTPDED